MLQALAESYEKGQLPVMLELLRQETAAEVTMVVSAGNVQARYFGGGSSSYGMRAGNMAEPRMAA
ncbi:hypothetical protein D3C85_1846140 [compost metagenome]